MKVVYNVGNEKHEAENVSTTIDQTSIVLTDQDKSLIDLESLGWKNGDIIVRKYVSRAEPNYFVFRNFGTTTEHGRVNVGTHIRFTKDRLFFGGYTEINLSDYEKADLQKKNDIIMMLRDYGYCWDGVRLTIVKRARYGHSFYFVSDKCTVETYKEEYDEISNEKWELGNYFLTEEECKTAAIAISYIFSSNKMSLILNWNSETSNS